MMINALRTVVIDRIDIDEAIGLVTFGRALKSSYSEFGMESPEWLNDNVEALEKEVRLRRRDNIEKELKDTDSRLEAMKTTEEKRSDLRAKRERLKAALG